MTADFDDFALPEPPSLRRAVFLGVLRTGFAAAAWLLVGALLVTFTGLILTVVRADHFHEVVQGGAMVGRPEYSSPDSGSCCSGLSFTVHNDLELTARGTIGGASSTTGEVWQGLVGGLTVQMPPAIGTPVGDALRRGQPAKAATKAFLATLPDSVSASAVVEFGTPLSPDDFFTLVPDSGLAFLTPPYDTPVASWDAVSLPRFTEWVSHLSGGDDDALQAMDAPSYEQLRPLAADPRIRGAVVERVTVAQLRTLLADPRVTSVNVAAVGYDPARQFPTS